MTSFINVPFGIGSDKRLTSADYVVVCSLLYWAGDEDRCTASDRQIGDFIHVSTSTVKRSLARLTKHGYIRRDPCRPTPDNMTGKVIYLLWISDPSIVPDPPSRTGPEEWSGSSAAAGR